MPHKVPGDIGEKIIHQPLLHKESTVHMESAPLCTITFFKGDIVAAGLFLHHRIMHVYGLNPWLGGKLGMVGDDLELVYPRTPIKNIFTVMIDPIKNIDITSDYDSLIQACIPLFIGGDGRRNGAQQLKAQSTVSRFVFVPTYSSDSDVPGFALVFSMSKVVADAFTYYEILNMLSDDPGATVRALNPVRKHEFETHHLQRLVGQESIEFHFSSAHSDAKFSGSLIPTLITPLAFIVDEQKVDHFQRERATGSYTTTDDIITSYLMNLCEPRLGVMEIDCRSRCPGLDSNDAGNYQGHVFYDPQGYRTPEAVRASMFPDSNGAYSGIRSGFPTSGEECKLAFINNWAINGTGPPFDLFLGGMVQQVLHLPLKQKLASNSNTDCTIVFRPVPSQLAVLVLAEGVNSETLLARNHPFGACVNMDMFPHSEPHFE